MGERKINLEQQIIAEKTEKYGIHYSMNKVEHDTVFSPQIEQNNVRRLATHSNIRNL